MGTFIRLALVLCVTLFYYYADAETTAETSTNSACPELQGEYEANKIQISIQHQGRSIKYTINGADYVADGKERVLDLSYGPGEREIPLITQKAQCLEHKKSGARVLVITVASTFNGQTVSTQSIYELTASRDLKTTFVGKELPLATKSPDVHVYNRKN